MHVGVQERRLRAENARLRRELALAHANAERAAMGAAAGTSGQPLPARGASPTGDHPMHAAPES